VIGLRPAEVGYIKLPVACAAATAPHDGYKLGMAVQVKPLAKPQRIRQTNGGGPVNALNEAVQAEMEELGKLHFSTDKQFGLSDMLEVPFGVMSGRVGHDVDPHPGWVSLWTMSDYDDPAGMFQSYAKLLAEHVLPKLTPEHMLEPLRQATLSNFEKAGYALKPAEALFIAKMLARVLQLADPVHDLGDYRADHVYNVLQTIHTHLGDGAEADGPVELPYWCQAMLRAIADNREAARHPVNIISQRLYHDLLRDAVPLAIQLIENEVGTTLGSSEDAQNYTEQLIHQLNQSAGLAFDYVYMPLVMGGLICGSRVVIQREHLDDSIRGLQSALEVRRAEQNEANTPVFEMAGQILDRYSQQFNFVM
jgi:hypothetical protein